jgi:triacylglycerol lipase
MIPFDGLFAQNTVYPLALGAYDATKPPPGFTAGLNAFEIIANLGHPDYLAQNAKSSPKHQKMMATMLAQPRTPTVIAGAAAAPPVMPAVAPAPNLHFGWICIDSSGADPRLIVAFRGTEYFKEWMDNIDFIPSPYEPIPGRGTVHQGFQLVYYSVRNNVRNLVQTHAAACKSILITGHSLGGALCALAAPDLLNDIAANLPPIVYTWAEPRVGHPDFVSFYNTHVNICYRIANFWDVVPHLPPALALYEHEGNELPIGSPFHFNVVENHSLATGYLPGLQKWNTDHPVQATAHFGNISVTALTGRTT